MHSVRRKAALSALSLTQAFAHDIEVVTELAAFAVEELEHFEAVLSAPRQTRLVPRAWWQGSVRCAADQRRRCRRQTPPGGSLTHRSVDRARSTERLKILVSTILTLNWRAFCRDLMATEAGHYMFFVRLAERVSDPAFAKARLAELAQRGGADCPALPHLPRVH